jgi:hypothetical protein
MASQAEGIRGGSSSPGSQYRLPTLEAGPVGSPPISQIESITASIPMDAVTVDRRWDFSPTTGTVDTLIPHMNMNKRPSKSRLARLKESGPRIQVSNLVSRHLRAPLPQFSPSARELLICLGWLRLFQVIILPQRKPIGRRSASYEV